MLAGAGSGPHRGRSRCGAPWKPLTADALSVRARPTDRVSEGHAWPRRGCVPGTLRRLRPEEGEPGGWRQHGLGHEEGHAVDLDAGEDSYELEAHREVECVCEEPHEPTGHTTHPLRLLHVL